MWGGSFGFRWSEQNILSYVFLVTSFPDIGTGYDVARVMYKFSSGLGSVVTSAPGCRQQQVLKLLRRDDFSADRRRLSLSARRCSLIVRIVIPFALACSERLFGFAGRTASTVLIVCCWISHFFADRRRPSLAAALAEALLAHRLHRRPAHIGEH